MKEYSASNIKSFAIIGHQGCGKTSLVESILFKTKTIEKKGSVEEGNTVSDFTKEEKNSGVSIYAPLIPVEHDECKYNILDCPGFFDFEMEAKNSLRAARNAVLVIDAVKGVEVGTKKNYK